MVSMKKMWLVYVLMSMSLIHGIIQNVYAETNPILTILVNIEKTTIKNKKQSNKLQKGTKAFRKRSSSY